MSEKYFAYISYFVLIAVIILPAVIWRWHTRLRFLQNLVRINILKRQQTVNQSLLFATCILNRITRILFFSRNVRALRALTGGNTAPAVTVLQSKHPELAVLLQAHTDMKAAYKTVKKHKLLRMDDPEYGVFLPILAYSAHDRDTLLRAIEKLSGNFKHLNRTAQAYHNFISAHAYLHEGDMLSASQNASAALKFFQKRQYAVETAACHLTLAQIYRISCVNDIANTMIESAIKIYQTQKAPLFLAEAVAAKGMLMVFENRFEEADAEYEKALNLPITEQLRADIFNQKTLLFLAQNKIDTARRYSCNALNLQQKLRNSYGIAFALQLAAHVAFQSKQYRKTAQTAQKACELYLKQKNFSATVECLYLAAEAEYKLRYYRSAENKLREILKINRAHPNSFHTANAYNLLGLIYLQKKNLQRAKVLFQQSLHLEQSHQRCEGLVADYANLAMIDELTNYSENAAANWKIALEYAEQTGDAELLNLIKKHYRG